MINKYSPRCPTTSFDSPQNEIDRTTSGIVISFGHEGVSRSSDPPGHTNSRVLGFHLQKYKWRFTTTQMRNSKEFDFESLEFFDSFKILSEDDDCDLFNDNELPI